MKRYLLLVLAVGVASGCARTAAFRMKDGRVGEGEIAKGSMKTIYFRTQSGILVPVARSEIEDIDHPGNVMASIGAGVGAIGLAVVLGSYIDGCKNDRTPTFDMSCGTYMGNIAPPGYAAIGAALPFVIWGLVDWGGSMRRAAVDDDIDEETVEDALRMILIAPHIDDKAGERGLVAGFRF